MPTGCGSSRGTCRRSRTSHATCGGRWRRCASARRRARRSTRSRSTSRRRSCPRRRSARCGCGRESAHLRDRRAAREPAYEVHREALVTCPRAQQFDVRLRVCPRRRPRLRAIGEVAHRHEDVVGLREALVREAGPVLRVQVHAARGGDDRAERVVGADRLAQGARQPEQPHRALRRRGHDLRLDVERERVERLALRRAEAHRRQRPPQVACDVRERRQVPRHDPQPVGMRGVDKSPQRSRPQQIDRLRVVRRLEVEGRHAEVAHSRHRGFRLRPLRAVPDVDPRAEALIRGRVSRPGGARRNGEAERGGDEQNAR